MPNWTKQVTHTAFANDNALQVRIYQGDTYAPVPNGFYYDASVPADTDTGALYYGDYTGAALSQSEREQLESHSNTIMDALIEAANVENYDGPVQFNVYYSDQNAAAPFQPRVYMYLWGQWDGYADIPLEDALTDATVRNQFIAAARVLRDHGLTQLGYQQQGS